MSWIPNTAGRTQKNEFPEDFEQGGEGVLVRLKE
jgi:hypothetical protein